MAQSLSSAEVEKAKEAIELLSSMVNSGKEESGSSTLSKGCSQSTSRPKEGEDKCKPYLASVLLLLAT